MTLRPNKIQNKRGLLIKNRDGTYNSKYPNGDKPNGCTDPSRIFTVKKDFNGSLGLKTSRNMNGFDGLDKNVIYTDEHKFSGKSSGKMFFYKESPQWGGSIHGEKQLEEGDEIFISFKVFYPGVGFELGGYKFVSADNTPIPIVKINDLKFCFNSRGSYTYAVKTPDGNTIECGERKYFNPKYNQWVEYKIHYIFSKKKGLVEIKENEKEIINRYTETLKENQSVKKIIFFPYYNSIQNQYCYIDDVIITSKQ